WSSACALPIFRGVVLVGSVLDEGSDQVPHRPLRALRTFRKSRMVQVDVGTRRERPGPVAFENGGGIVARGTGDVTGDQLHPPDAFALCGRGRSAGLRKDPSPACHVPPPSRAL